MFFNLVADPGVRSGTTFGTVLSTLPILLLLHQAVRLGTAARERRLAALRVAGATPGQVRLLGSLEVGIPSFVGGVGGVYGLLRLMFGGMSYAEAGSVPLRQQQLRLVPTTVTPAWWQVLLVILAVTLLLGVAVGALGVLGLVVTPLGVTRRQRTAPPRPWGLLLLVLAAAIAPLAFDVFANATASTLVGIVCVALSVLGIASLAPWVTYRVGHRLTRLEDRVLMVLDDTPTFPALFLGAMRSGAVPAPVSFLDTTENFAHYARDSYAKLVVAEDALLSASRPARWRAARSKRC